jgi:hypothetical protein
MKYEIKYGYSILPERRKVNPIGEYKFYSPDFDTVGYFIYMMITLLVFFGALGAIVYLSL